MERLRPGTEVTVGIPIEEAEDADRDYRYVDTLQIGDDLVVSLKDANDFLGPVVPTMRRSIRSPHSS